MEEHDKIELRSEDVQEILGTPPSWILRWGTILIFMGIGILAWVVWVVKYPDIIHAPILITTEMPPVPVVARSTGYLSRLIVKDGDTVKAGNLLVVLQSTANYEDIIKLENKLAQLDSLTPSVFSAFKPESNLILGSLQLNYSAFIQILKEFQFKKEENFGAQNVVQIQQQILSTRRLIRVEQDRLNSTERNAKLAQENFNVQQRLYNQHVISLVDLQNAKKEVNRQEQDVKSVRSRIEELNGEVLRLQKSILEVNQLTKETNTNKYVSLVESINQLRSAITEWKQNYLMTAPIDGKVSFYNNYWAENQDVKENAEVMAILPPNGSGMVGIVDLPMPSSGKVREKQRVVIKFASYPFQEFGVVEGLVVSKALLPKDKNNISVRVSLPNGLKTTYKKELRFDQQMQGSAEIITEERRFAERMFENLISAFKNRY